MTMRTDDFDYELPPELIAQNPPEHRGESRMLVLNPDSQSFEIVPFHDLTRWMRKDDLLVRNNTRVIRARLFAKKSTGAKIELFLQGLVSHRSDVVWNCMMKPAKRVAEGALLQLLRFDGETFADSTVTLLKKLPDGTCIVEFHCQDMEQVLRECGHLPLPPYINRKDAELDSARYQTIYANEPGAVAAPTAGLHFTESVFERLKAQGVNLADLTLHVGAGTFKPVSESVVSDHKMHSESFFLSQSTAERLNETRRCGGRILAVGTTSLRTLETCVRKDGTYAEMSGSTDIFIYPPYQIRSADMLLTNFHLPKSTLLMLVAAFAGKELIMRAYHYAIQEKMRFFSYGDCMLILKHV